MTPPAPTIPTRIKSTVAENQTSVLDGDPDATGTQTPTYSATDDDADTLTYAVTGADAKYFFIATAGGELAFCGVGDPSNNTVRDNDACTEAHSPDYEKKSSYSISVTATDGDNAVAKVDVTVTVTNANDAGKVEFSQRTPQVDRAVVADPQRPRRQHQRRLLGVGRIPRSGIPTSDVR